MQPVDTSLFCIDNIIESGPIISDLAQTPAGSICNQRSKPFFYEDIDMTIDLFRKAISAALCNLA